MESERGNMKIHNISGGVIYEDDAPTMANTVQAAVDQKVNLDGAYLQKENLSNVDFRNTNLCNIDLHDADLTGVILPEKTVIYTDIWTVLIHGERIKIGCQEHSVSDWFSFSDDQINEMHHLALKFWGCNKRIIFEICKSFGWVK